MPAHSSAPRADGATRGREASIERDAGSLGRDADEPGSGSGVTVDGARDGIVSGGVGVWTGAGSALRPGAVEIAGKDVSAAASSAIGAGVGTSGTGGSTPSEDERGGGDEGVGRGGNVMPSSSSLFTTVTISSWRLPDASRSTDARRGSAIHEEPVVGYGRAGARSVSTAIAAASDAVRSSSYKVSRRRSRGRGGVRTRTPERSLSRFFDAGVAFGFVADTGRGAAPTMRGSTPAVRAARAGREDVATRPP